LLNIEKTPVIVRHNALLWAATFKKPLLGVVPAEWTKLLLTGKNAGSLMVAGNLRPVPQR
jgi:hypothetical protein